MATVERIYRESKQLEIIPKNCKLKSRALLY